MNNNKGFTAWNFALKTARNMLYRNHEEKKNSEQGASAIEFVIGSLIFVILFAAFLDVLVLTWKFTVVSQSTSNVARVSGLQGGLLSSRPEGFPGNSYVTASSMKHTVKEMYNSSGIRDNDWTVTVNGSNLGVPIKVDYRNQILVKTEMRYKWHFLSALVPGELNSKVNVARVSMSEFKYRYDSWEGE